MMDSIVESITAFDANMASLSNSSANIVVVAATGIASAVTVTRCYYLRNFKQI